MATRALSADARRASLEIAPNFPPITRRGFASLAAIGAVATITPASVAASASAPVRKWDLLIARYEAAMAADEAFDRDVYGPAEAKLKAQIGPVPARDFALTAKSGAVAHYPVDRGEDQLPWGAAFDPARKMAREFAVFRERTRRIETQSWWLGVEARSDKLMTAVYTAEQAVLLAPAPDGAAPARKVAIMFERRLGEVGDDVVAVMKADAARLA